MAIATDSLIDFFGTQDSIDDGTTSAITGGSFSVTSDIITWNNNDDAPAAVLVFRCQWATSPTDGSVINIYGRKLNVQSVNDTPTPSSQNLDQFIGSFTIDGDVAINTDTYNVTNWVTLPNHVTNQAYDFYFENATGQTITAGWAVWITPVTKGPHA